MISLVATHAGPCLHTQRPGQQLGCGARVQSGLARAPGGLAHPVLRRRSLRPALPPAPRASAGSLAAGDLEAQLEQLMKEGSKLEPEEVAERVARIEAGAKELGLNKVRHGAVWHQQEFLVAEWPPS